MKRVAARQVQDKTPRVLPNYKFDGRLFDLETAAAYTSLSTWTIRDYIEQGFIPVVSLPNPFNETKRLNRVLIERKSLDAFLDKFQPEVKK